METMEARVARLKSGLNSRGERAVVGEKKAAGGNGVARSTKAAKPPKKVGDTLRSQLKSRFKLTCTTCFNAVIRELNSLPVADVRLRSADFTKSVYENAKESSRAKAVLEWADFKTYGFDRYEQLVLDACDTCEPPKPPECTNPDIVVSSNSHGFGDAMILSWVAEGAKLQGIKIAHYATGKMAELLLLFGQNVTSNPKGAKRIEPIYKKLAQLGGKESYLNLYCEWLGVKEVVRPKLIELPQAVEEWAAQQTEKPTVLLFPQCTRVIRTWPQNYWLELQSMLRSRGVNARLVVWNDKQDWRRHSPDSLVDLSWAETVALMLKSKMVIGNNSGCVHVAGTLDVPTMVLSGLTTAESLDGIPSMHHVSVDVSECHCVGCCYASPPRTKVCERGCLALQLLTPRIVLEQFDAVAARYARCFSQTPFDFRVKPY